MYKIPDSIKGKVGSYDLSSYNKSTPSKNQSIIDEYVKSGKEELNLKTRTQLENRNKKSKLSNKNANFNQLKSKLLGKLSGENTTTSTRNIVSPKLYDKLQSFRSTPKPEPEQYEEDELDEYEDESVDNNEKESAECYLTTQSSLEDIINAVNYLMSCMKEEDESDTPPDPDWER